MGYRPWSRKELDKTERLNSKSNSSSTQSLTQNKGNISPSTQMSHHYVVYMKLTLQVDYISIKKNFLRVLSTMYPTL